MKEKLYTIELMDAVRAGDECILCYLNRKLEQEAIAFVLGSSYMESDIRERTDRQGFCQVHTKQMFDYGNSLGNAWILKTRLANMRSQLEMKIKSSQPAKVSWLARGKKNSSEGSTVGDWIRETESSCYICNRVRSTYERVLGTVVYLLNLDDEFLTLLKKSKGFCIHHFADVADCCEHKLKEEKKAACMTVLYDGMLDNLNRVQEDINWFIEKFDYLNKDADWKDSKDALQRTMQKLTGGYPADPVFRKQ